MRATGCDKKVERKIAYRIYAIQPKLTDRSVLMTVRLCWGVIAVCSMVSQAEVMHKYALFPFASAATPVPA